jgi:hypothetical protein
MSTTIYGCSDDLIELDGDIYDEIGCYEQPTRIKFDNGVLLGVEYEADGHWRITLLTDSEGVSIVKAEDRPGYTDVDGEIYSDLATVTGATSFKSKRWAK